MLFIDVTKAHLVPKCEEDVYIRLPPEANAALGLCGKLNYWLYGFRPAAQAWEKFYAEKLESVGFVRGVGCSVVFYNAEKDLSCGVIGDDFTFCGYEEDLKEMAELMRTWFAIKVRAVLGGDPADDKEVVILGRTIKWCDWGIEYKADEKHRQILMERFGFDAGTRELQENGDHETKDDEEWEKEYLVKEEATEYRAISARLNFLGQDSPDLQFPAKEASREMAKPKKGSWKRIKKTIRFLVGREKVVWNYPLQEEVEDVDTFADSDWGGRVGSRFSTSGGAMMLGGHCIKTWGTTQGAIALSSAEAEFYAMIEAVLRAKGLRTLAMELGCLLKGGCIKLATDSSAAKSFVSRRGFGKMRHLEIKDLWLQKEVGEGKVKVWKIPGDKNPADLMTKNLKIEEIRSRLLRLGLTIERRPNKGRREVAVVRRCRCGHL